MTFSYKSAIAILTCAAFFFAQLMVAAHACPSLARAIAEATVVADCECPADSATASALCKKHCGNDKQNLAAHLLLEATTFIPAHELMMPTDTSISATRDEAYYLLSMPPHYDPPLLKYANLRI